MSVYVDKAVYGYGRMIMCHMIADTPEELHVMADKIGVARRWFQDPRTMNVSMPHYDIAKSKRAIAVSLGAVECDRRAFVEAVRRIMASERRLRGRWATERAVTDRLAARRERVHRLAAKRPPIRIEVAREPSATARDRLVDLLLQLMDERAHSGSR